MTSVSTESAAKPLLSPQQRWQTWRARLPQWTPAQRRLALIGGVLVIFLFCLFLLPYLLPLSGPKPVDPHQLADPNGHFVEINGIEVYYTHSPGEGMPVVLIHGQMGSTHTWQATIPALQEAGFDVYAIDLAGAGLSQKGLALDYSHPAQAELILAWMAALDIERAHLVAHAFGGNIAMTIALNHPERVEKLALAAPTFFYEGGGTQVPPFLFDLPFVERWARVFLQLVWPDAIGEQLRSAAKLDEAITDALIEDYSRALYTQDWDLSLIGLVRDYSDNALPKALSELRAPLLLVWGSRDGWAAPNSLDSVEDEFADLTRVEFAEVGHLPMHEVPDDFNAALIRFLQN